MECPHCREVTGVSDIFVAAGPFVIYRELLTKNMQKYRRLVSEIECEIVELQKAGSENRAYDISARSLSHFVAHLKEMLDGCRDIVRHNISGVKAQYTIDGRRYRANVLNLSASGICLDAGKTASVNRLWSEATVQLKGDGTGAFNLRGKIIWLGKDGRMGMKFTNVDSELAKLIETFIIEKTSKKPQAPRAKIS